MDFEMDEKGTGLSDSNTKVIKLNDFELETVVNRKKELEKLINICQENLNYTPITIRLDIPLDKSIPINSTEAINDYMRYYKIAAHRLGYTLYGEGEYTLKCDKIAVKLVKIELPMKITDNSNVVYINEFKRKKAKQKES